MSGLSFEGSCDTALIWSLVWTSDRTWQGVARGASWDTPVVFMFYCMWQLDIKANLLDNVWHRVWHNFFLRDFLAAFVAFERSNKCLYWYSYLRALSQSVPLAAGNDIADNNNNVKEEIYDKQVEQAQLLHFMLLQRVITILQSRMSDCDTVGLILPVKQETGKTGPTLDAVWLDVPPVLEAKLFVLDQVVADGDAAMRVGLHEGDSGQALGNSRESHRVWIRWHIWNDRIMRCAQRQLFPFIPFPVALC